VAAWLLIPAWIIFWRTRVRNLVPKIRDNPLLATFKKATLENYLEVFGYRLAGNVAGLAAGVVMLKAVGINAPLALLFAGVPIMVDAAYWPVSAGGFGSPQIVALVLLRDYASKEAILAFSLAWSALFFIVRTLTGLPFIRPVYKSAFPPKSRT